VDDRLDLKRIVPPVAGVADDHVETIDESVAGRRTISPVPLPLKIRRAIWSAVQATFFRWSLHTANGFRSALLRLFGAKVGRHCTIRRTASVYYPWQFVLGDLSSLGDRATIYNLGPVTIGRRVTISQEAYLCAGTHDYRLLSMPLMTPPITIGDDAWICARAFVGPGIEVADGAILAACGVAVENLEEWSIYAGNPATKKKDRPRLR
jgi:putative colanic acid biosynthesis acetyltransferase WcaF